MFWQWLSSRKHIEPSLFQLKSCFLWEENMTERRIFPCLCSKWLNKQEQGRLSCTPAFLSAGRVKYPEFNIQDQLMGLRENATWRVELRACFSSSLAQWLLGQRFIEVLIRLITWELPRTLFSAQFPLTEAFGCALAWGCLFSPRTRCWGGAALWL